MDWPISHSDVHHLIFVIMVADEITLVIDFGVHLRPVVAAFQSSLSTLWTVAAALVDDDPRELSLEGLDDCLPLHFLVLSVVLNEVYLLKGVRNI